MPPGRTGCEHCQLTESVRSKAKVWVRDEQSVTGSVSSIMEPQSVEIPLCVSD